MVITSPDLLGNVKAGDGASLLGDLDPGGGHHRAVVTRGHAIQTGSEIRSQERLSQIKHVAKSPVINDNLTSLVHSARDVSEYLEVT